MSINAEKSLTNAHFQKYRFAYAKTRSAAIAPFSDTRILLSKKANRFYESLPETCAAPLLRKQSDFAKFDVPSGQEIAVFHEIPSPLAASLRTHSAM